VTREQSSEWALESTGDQALDNILGGGLPALSTVVIAGEPGSGKTVLTLQTLFHAAREGKKCLYFTTLSEPAIKVIRFMQRFDFFDVRLLDEQILFADLGSSLRHGPEHVLADIAARVERSEPSFVAIDSFRALTEAFHGSGAGRSFVYDLAVQMATWGATALLVGEYTRDEFRAFPEFAIADGIIRLGSETQELTSVREIEVMKMRGAGYASGRHFFDIGRRGVTFYPRVSTPTAASTLAHPAAGERSATGVAGLDDLLAGGLPRHSATLLEGGTGTGKTLLSMKFLIEGVARGERGVLFTLEEAPEQIRANARSVGWDLAPLEAAGQLAIKYASPVELSTDRFLYEARTEVESLGASRVVFDSLTTMALGVPSERRFKEMVYAIAKHMRNVPASLMMTVESPQLLGAAQLSGQGVSFIADNVIQLRYVEMEGRLERAISVLKARGIQHSSELRSLTVGNDGLKVVGGRFKDMRGVLTGLPAHHAGEPK
jgi:circadian clock protein KaiC